MAATEHYFVEWKEQYVSKERGNRVVHYFLKDNSGESILAVVGTERSVRHMFYVVSEEFLNAHAAKNSVHAGFRWRSRREVVNWLTSMLSKQHIQADCPMSPKENPAPEINARQTHMPAQKGRVSRNLKAHHLDIVWSGVAWTCGKQLKHYPAFYRNGITIPVQSFVFVMAEKENRYIAYLEDMYEDRKCQKKVKVRWFHHNREVRGIVSLRNPHPKEVFITPYVQVISAECVDGPAIVLTGEHYEKCLAVFPHDLVGKVHFCFRQFKSNRVKPFKLSKLRGYFDQPFFSCFSPDFFEEEEFSSEDDVKVGAKRSRRCRDHQKEARELSYKKLKYGLLGRKPNFFKHVEGHVWHTPTFKVNDKIEFLCQDSGIRGCWFRCTVLEVSGKQMKIQYDDVKDEDSCSNLEEWIPTYRLARTDKLGMRHPGRPTIRPACPCDQGSRTFEVGAPVDTWWSDGWWEGVISGTSDGENGNQEVYIPGEDLFLNIEGKSLRVSRDWIGDQWVDIKPNSNILSLISATSIDAKLLASPAIVKETKSDNSRTSCHKVLTNVKLSVVEEEIRDVGGTTPATDHLKDDCSNEDKHQTLTIPEKGNNIDHVNEHDEKDNADYNHSDANIVDKSCNDDGKDDKADGCKEDNLVELEIAGARCEAETKEVMT
ncbi:agenet domain-containing protein/bromo-adjacent-like proteiny (BAH) domain-containing protein [Forsythia ovata]|uniref:Agenet domain-containing protein/bromo-adjacent-like proteiny (BAH) domain-containing protein n=1 Tax=Forsythia ovata TaxID=205694 RepID=A0ABD1QDI0_9LAMI